jgi:uncharacterized protein (DUF488 family)
MSYYDAKAVKDSIDVELTDIDVNQYHVEYELFDGADKYGIRFVSDYEITKVVKDGVEIKKATLGAYARNQIELAIEKKHGLAISGI